MTCSRAVGVDTVPYVSAGIHHHDVGGENGQPHGDLNPVYFAEVEPRDGMVSLGGDLVDLKSGRRLQENTRVTRHVRPSRSCTTRPTPRGTAATVARRDSTSARQFTDGPRWLWRRSTTPSWHSSALPTLSTVSFRTGSLNVTRSRCGCTAPTSAAATRWGERNLEQWQESPPPTEAVET